MNFYVIFLVTANEVFGAENLASIEVFFNHYQIHANDGLVTFLNFIFLCKLQSFLFDIFKYKGKSKE